MEGPIHYYNQSVLGIYNYTVYSNGTVSNGSQCFLTFGIYQPTLFENGSFFNTTSCDTPYYPVHSRGIVGVVFAIIMLMLLPASLFNLRKHGARYIEEKKRFKNVSRRWPWYWILILQVLCGISGFFSIDLDRDYLQGTSLTIYGAIFTAILPIALSACWELTRHWGSFEERKLDDADPFRFRQNDIRTKIHLLMPLGYYLLAVVTFFLTVLRNWNQIVNYISIFSVSIRWKIGVMFAYMTWLQIILQIFVTRFYYKVSSIPLVIPACLLCLLAEIIYSTVAAWNVNFNAFNTHSSVVFVALMAYLPLLLFVCLMNLSGLARENEDLVILARRRIRKRRASRGIFQVMEDRKKVNNNNYNTDSAISGDSNSNRINEDTGPLSSAFSFISNGTMTSENDRNMFSFKNFLGAGPTQGHTWLTHNLKYIPCSSRKSEFQIQRATSLQSFTINPDHISHQDEMEELNRFQAHKSSVSGRNQGKFVKNSGMAGFFVREKTELPQRPPPVDLRVKWKKLEDAKRRRETTTSDSIISIGTKVDSDKGIPSIPLLEDDKAPLFPTTSASH